MGFVGNLFLFPAAIEFWESIKNWQSYRHEYGVLLFGDTVYMLTLVCLFSYFQPQECNKTPCQCQHQSFQVKHSVASATYKKSLVIAKQNQTSTSLSSSFLSISHSTWDDFSALRTAFNWSQNSCFSWSKYISSCTFAFLNLSAFFFSSVAFT